MSILSQHTSIQCLYFLHPNNIVEESLIVVCNISTFISVCLACSLTNSDMLKKNTYDCVQVIMDFCVHVTFINVDFVFIQLHESCKKKWIHYGRKCSDVRSIS